jgi:photosystem II stability/assembly factor-like uncharacterized protein
MQIMKSRRGAICALLGALVLVSINTLKSADRPSINARSSLTHRSSFKRPPLSSIMQEHSAPPSFRQPRSHSSAQNQSLQSAYLGPRSRWFAIHPLPTNLNIFGVHLFDDGQRAIAVGDGGLYMTTTNGGSTWNVLQNFKDNIWFGKVRFIGHSKGIITGFSGEVLSTSDGGALWKVTQPDQWWNEWHDISFVDSMHAWMVGSWGSVFETSDGGESWVNRSIPGLDSRELTSCLFLTRTTGFVLVSDYIGGTNNYIMRTTDEGATWQVCATVVNQFLESIAFSDPLNGIVAGYGANPTHGTLDSAVVLRTTDGGLSWSYSSSGIPKCGLEDICHVGGGTFVAVGNDIHLSTDGGRHWADVGGGNAYLNAVAFNHSGQGMACGEWGSVWTSQDSGHTWSEATNDYRREITSMSILDEKTAITGGDDIRKSTDGGVTWKTIRTGWSGACRFWDEKHGLYTDYAPSWIWSTTDGGGTWSIKFESTGWLRGICCVDSNTAFVVGDNGEIVRTTDGGSSWDVLASNITDGLNGVAFWDRYNGIAVGDGGTIVRTSDMGATWQAQSVGDYDYLFDASLVGAATAFVSGHGVVLKTTDRGNSWVSVDYSPQGFKPNDYLQSVSFFDENLGTVVEPMGGIHTTTDGGQTWHDETAQTKFGRWGETNAVQYSRSKPGGVGYIVGDGGVIFCCSVSPLRVRTWTWRGTVDSSWNKAENWSPVGIPIPGDSVIIPAAVQHPVVCEEQQQLAIGSLIILAGGRLTITDALKRFAVLGDVSIFGTLEITANARVSIVVGGSWTVRPGDHSDLKLSRSGISGTIDEGFLPARSAVYFRGNGTLGGNFYDLFLDSTGTMQTAGNVIIGGTATLTGGITLRDVDTIAITNVSPQAVLGPGRIKGSGTVRRVIQGNAEEGYRFESSSTTVRFAANSSLESVMMRTYANVDPDSMAAGWIEVPSHIDQTAHVAIADSVHEFSRWTIKIPKLQPNGGATVQRVYDIEASGSGPYTATLSLRYEASELPPGIQEGALRLFRTEITSHVPGNGTGSTTPVRSDLQQNFPNPFNPTTSIGYTVAAVSLPAGQAGSQRSADSRVRLAVYDLLGREVAVLVNEKKAPGNYEVQFNASGLASGIYFYRLMADGFIQTRKMQLLK